MLLDNPWFGPFLKQWEESKTVSSKAKFRGIVLVLLTFSISIYIVRETWPLQALLVAIFSLLVFLMLRLKAQNQNYANNQ